MKRISMSFLALLLAVAGHIRGMENNQESTVTQNSTRPIRLMRILGSSLASVTGVICGLLLGASAGYMICNGNETCESLMSTLGALTGGGGGVWLGEKINPVNSRKHESPAS
jgi:outer membrane lipoprotein SlyB